MTAPPRALKKPMQDVRHGLTRKDDYAWLKADNWREVLQDGAVLPDNIRAHLEAENQYAEQVLKPVAQLQETLFQEMKARIPPDDQSVPEQDGDYFYYDQFTAQDEHPRLCRTYKDSKQEIMLDGNKEAQNHDFFKLGGAVHSPDHQQLAWSADLSGGEYYTIRVRDLAARKDMDTITHSDGAAIWAADSRHIFYVHVDENHRSSEVRCHRVGSDPARDEIVFREPNPAYFLSLDKTQSEDYITINSYDHTSSEVHLISAHEPKKPSQLVAVRRDNIEYSLEHDRAHQRFFMLTNENAIDFKIMSAPERNFSQWRDFIPAREGAYILDCNLYRNHLVWLLREDGHPRLMMKDLTSGEISELSFGDEPHDLEISPGLTYETDMIRIHYSSLRQPEQVYDVSMTTQKRTLRKTQEIPGGHNPDDYVTKRLFAQAHDGEVIPISLLYHARTPPDGARPVLLYGYGAYGITIPAYFSTARLSLVDRGFAFAIAHIRGGSAKGRRWYQNGKLARKTNSFKDFISAAEYLVRQKYARRGNITAQGGSAGGMLMGAVANMAPDLFRAIIAQVPFVDVLATMLDDELPLTPPEWPEWGNPITSKTAYEQIAAYSPYDNVAPQSYPWILATGGLTDPRVGYWEPAKWVARLRAAQQGQAPIVLKTEMRAGHGGKSGRFLRLEETAQTYAFALLAHGNASLGGLTPSPPSAAA